MIDRDQVLHVARLARLRLADDEIDAMSRELSSVLDHIEKISELDLSDVEPTSHVVAVENVLRPDEPRPSWPKERVLASAPDREPGRLPRPHPGPVSTAPLELTAAQAIAAIEAGELSAGELWNVYAERIQRHDPDIGAFLWTADAPPRAIPARRWQASRWRSRTSSAPRASRPPPARGSSRGTCRSTRRRRCGSSRRPARR